MDAVPEKETAVPLGKSDEKTRGADIYLVYGWKLPQASFRNVLADMKPEAQEAGLRVIFTEKGLDAYLGQVLAILFGGGSLSAFACPPPKAEDAERLRNGMSALRLEALAKEEPLLWVVAG